VLDSITVEGFKSIASIQDLELGPINVLIGPNGSGKSNFIGAFRFLHAIRSGRLREYVIRAGGAERILHFGTKATSELFAKVSFDNDKSQYEIRLLATETDALHPYSEIVYFWDELEDTRRSEDFLLGRRGEAGISENHPRGATQYVQNQLDSWRLHHFHDTSSGSPLKKTSVVNDNRFLRADGSNLAAFLHLLRTKHETEYNLVRRTLQLVAPFFDDFILQPMVENEELIRIEWRHRSHGDYFDVASFSDGTLRFVALATLLLQPPSFRPTVILIDEPELGLHPYAITLLAALVKQASVNTQVILATQSPALLDHFDPDEVLVADRIRGRTEFRRLDARNLEDWLEDYTLGQLWEKNHLGGRPAGEIIGNDRDDQAALVR